MIDLKALDSNGLKVLGLLMMATEKHIKCICESCKLTEFVWANFGVWFTE